MSSKGIKSAVRLVCVMAVAALVLLEQGSAAYTRDPLPFNGNFLGKRAGGPGFDLAYLPKSGYFIGKRFGGGNFAGYLAEESTRRNLCEEAAATCAAWFAPPAASDAPKNDV